MPPKKKAAAKKTVRSSTGRSRNATTAAVTKFEEEFERSLGVNLRTNKPKRPEVVTSGSMALDFASTIGGIPTARVVEMWGPEHAGKTTLAIIMAIQRQKRFPLKKVAWVDMEQTFDEVWAEKLGLDLSRVWFYTPETAEDVGDAIKRFVRSGMVSFLVLDSIGGMITRVQIEKESDEATVGDVAKVVTRMVKIASPAAFRNGTTFCVVNQVRAHIGQWGPDEDTGGGWALKHITVMKMSVRRVPGEGTTHTTSLPGHDKPVECGHKMAVRFQKNKMGPAGTVAEMWLHNIATDAYGPIGIDYVAEVFDFAKRFGLMGSGAGGNYVVEGEPVKGGQAKVLDHLRQHPEVVEVLRTKVLDTVSGKVVNDMEPPPVSKEEAAALDSDDPLGMSEMVS